MDDAPEKVADEIQGTEVAADEEPQVTANASTSEEPKEKDSGPSKPLTVVSGEDFLCICFTTVPKGDRSRWRWYSIYPVHIFQYLYFVSRLRWRFSFRSRQKSAVTFQSTAFKRYWFKSY